MNNEVSFNIIINNKQYSLLELKEMFGYIFITFIMRYRVRILRLIRYIIKLLKIPNYYPYLIFISKLIFIKILSILIKKFNMRLSYVKTNNHFYKKYKNGKKVRISKKIFLKHQDNFDSDGDIEMEKIQSPTNMPKSILKRTKKGTRTEVWSDKQVRFTDNIVKLYYLSEEEKKMKIKAYTKIKRKNRRFY